jgi:hypothetical protein
MKINGIKVDSLGPERISIASIFDVAEESVVFDSTEELDPFAFNHFKTTFTKIVFSDSIRVGATIL